MGEEKISDLEEELNEGSRKEGLIGRIVRIASYALLGAAVIFAYSNSTIEGIDPRTKLFDEKYKKVSMNYDENKDKVLSPREYFVFHSDLLGNKEVYFFNTEEKLSHKDVINWPEYADGSKVPLDSLNHWLDSYLKVEKN